MAITSVGSSFNQIQPLQAVRETAASSRVREAADASVDGSKDWPPRTASQMRAEQLDKTAYGRLIAAQEEAASRPAVSARSAAAAYATR